MLRPFARSIKKYWQEIYKTQAIDLKKSQAKNSSVFSPGFYALRLQWENAMVPFDQSLTLFCEKKMIFS